jgi:isocitrate/isopropylmalate dehydrogenase
MDSPIIADELGPIRYDWPNIQLLFTAGASPADIAKALTKDCPDQYDVVRNTVAKRSQRYEWGQIAEDARKLASSEPRAISAIAKSNSALSTNVLAGAANVFAERKSRYLEVTTDFVDRSVSKLKDHPINNLADASVAAKLMEPVHKIAVDIHGLNAKDSPAALQVNFLGSPDACKVTLDADIQTST